MVSRKHFLICMLLALLRNAASNEFVDYSNNAFNATTSGPTHMLSTSNFIDTSTSSSSIFSGTGGTTESETTTKLKNKDTTYGEESLSNNGAKKIMNNSLNYKDYLKNESEHTTKAEIDIPPTTNADQNSEIVDIAKNVTTSNKIIFDNMNNERIAETTSITIIGEMITNSTEKITKNSATTKFRVKCDVQMNNGDPKSVRTDACGCADGYEIIELDEFKNKINKTCVEILPETTTKSEEMKTTVSSEEQTEIRTPLLYSTIADFIPSKKPKENDNGNISFSQIHNTTQTDVSNHNTGFAIIATTSVSPNDNWVGYSDATTKPAMPSVASSLSGEARLRNNIDHSTDSNTLAKQEVSYEQVGTSSTPYIILPSPRRRKENFRTNGSQMTYNIIGSALITAMLIASGIHYLWSFRRKCDYEITHFV